MMPERVARSTADIRERKEPERSSLAYPYGWKPIDDSIYFVLQVIERGLIPDRKGTDHYVCRFSERNQPGSYQLSQPASQLVSFNDRMSEFPDHDTHSCMRKQGVDGPNLEMFGTQSSPCSFHVFQI
jgi:hypothetical protein